MISIDISKLELQLLELIQRVEAGETIEITRDGVAIARLAPPTPARKPIDVAALRALTSTMAFSEQSAADLVRAMRDDSY